MWNAVLLASLPFGAQGQAHAPAPVASVERVPTLPSDLTDRERSLWIAFARPRVPGPVPSNAWSEDPAAARLGQALFFDPGLSGNGRISCSTCHDPARGWSDGQVLARGLAPGVRHTPSVVNAAYSPWLFWDGRSDSLWSQALAPIENPAEMGGSRVDVARYLGANAHLSRLYSAAFGAVPDCSDEARFPPGAKPGPIDPANPFALPEATPTDPAVAAWVAMGTADREQVDQVFARVGKAIGAFERTLTSGESTFDRIGRQLAGDPLPESIPRELLHGWRLFVGRAGCVSCHFGSNFTDGQFHNLGLPALAPGLLDEARTDGIRRVRVSPWNGRGRNSDARDWASNQKLLYLSSSEHLLGAYKTPSLRDLVRTAPYGHDGRFPALGDVLDFYSDLPGEPAIGHREETLAPLDLDAEEKQALLTLLEALTGPPVTGTLQPAPESEGGLSPSGEGD